MKTGLLIGAAGFLGTLLRYVCVRTLNQAFPAFPWGTLTVNIAGAMTAGFCFVFLREKFPQFEAWFPILFVGFLGAFTTFSSFALESVRFLVAARWGLFFRNILLQNATGVIAAWGGMQLAKWISTF